MIARPVIVAIKYSPCQCIIKKNSPYYRNYLQIYLKQLIGAEIRWFESHSSRHVGTLGKSRPSLVVACMT